LQDPRLDFDETPEPSFIHLDNADALVFLKQKCSSIDSLDVSSILSNFEKIKRKSERLASDRGRRKKY